MNTEIRIIGMDDQRPARVRKEAYIDLVFKLSDKPPSAWIDIFATLGRQIEPSVKIDKTAEDCIVAWVRQMDEITAHFASIKKIVGNCNNQYREKLQQQALAAQNQVQSAASQAQEKLNAIIAGLEFD